MLEDPKGDAEANAPLSPKPPPDNLAVKPENIGQPAHRHLATRELFEHCDGQRIEIHAWQ